MKYKDMLEMKINTFSQVDLDELSIDILRVPGGWIYYRNVYSDFKNSNICSRKRRKT